MSSTADQRSVPDEQAPPAPAGASTTGDDTEAAIQITDVTKTFGRGRSEVVALEGVSLSVAQGEFVCLIGASGCGKSTLL
jgi:ABC-type glutathione transport system ATPase component